jgi:subtilisin family serine protease/formylglycine-generating enzyme required for sulfatase activity
VKTKKILSSLALFLIFLNGGKILHAEEAVVVEGKILVRFETGLATQEIESIEREYSLIRVNFISAINTGYYRFPAAEDQIELIDRLSTRKGVVLVEEDLLRKQLAPIPNDPLYGQQWYLDSASAVHIGFASAIQAFAGATTVDVAVIDSGILYNHPEFSGKINTTWAFDYVENDTTAQDENGHGTMVASLIGAAHGNGGGIAGVCPNVRILPIRVFDNAGRFATTTSGVLVSALQRAYDANVRIVNLSLGGGGYSASELAMFDALNAKGILAVIAAGNGDSAGIGINNDATPTYPASYNSPNIISVMATDSSGNPTIFSNYGASSVDIAAPGANILAANVRRQTVYNDVFANGASGWLTATAAGGTPWSLNSLSFYGSFTPYNASGIYKNFTFTGRQGLRAELNGFFILGVGDIILLEVWNGTGWDYVDVLAWPGDFFLTRNLDISAFDGMTGYARISLYCDVYAYGSSYNRYAEIDSIRITEVAPNSSSNPEYLSVNGTSFSAPLVTGTAALLLSKNPNLSVSDLRAALLNTTSTRSSLAGKCSTGGILNVSSALAAAEIKESQTISFSSIASKSFGDSSFALNASASSGLPITYSSSNPGVATVTGSSVTITGAGTTTITASQAGNSQYYAAPSIQQTLTVNPKPLVIVADAITKMIGASDPALTYTTTGLVAGSIVSGVLVREAGESVGSYAITQGSLTAGANYSIQFTGALLTITPKALDASQIIFVEPESLQYSKSPKTFSVTANPHPSATNQTIGLSSIGLPDSGYGTVNTLGAAGFRAVTNVGVDGVFRPHQSATKISSTGLQYSFSPSHVSANPGGDSEKAPWQRTTAATGGPTNQLSNYFNARGINWSSNSLFAVSCAGITIDLSEIKPQGRTFTKFTTYFGMHSENSMGDAAYVILLDGVFVTGERTFIFSNPYSNLIEVPIQPTSRFLTLVAGDNGDDLNWDHAVFVDPKLTAEPAAPLIAAEYAGINGTTYGPSAAAPQNAGQYRLTVTSLDSEAPGSVTRDFTISRKSLSITASPNQAKVFGDAETELLYTASGLIDGDTIVGSLTRESGENVGTYQIQLGTLSAGDNYQIDYFSDFFSISSQLWGNHAFLLRSPTGQIPSTVVGDGIDPVNETYSATPKTFSVLGFNLEPINIEYSVSYLGVNGTSYGPSLTPPTNVGSYRVIAESADPNIRANDECNLVIVPKTLSVRGLSARSRTYNGTTNVVLDGTPSYEGLIEGENFTIVGTASGGFADKNVGTNKLVTVSGLAAPSSNYTLTNLVLSASIEPKPLTVQPHPQTKIYGDDDPAFTYSASGLLDGDFLTGSLSRTAGEGSGEYAITIGTLSAGANYLINLAPEILTIQTVSLTEADIQIFPPESLFYSAAPKAFTASTAGVSSFLYSYIGIGGTTYGPTSEPPTNAGQYSFLATSGDSNYSGSKSLEFTILKAPLTISADPKTKYFGESNPLLTFTSTGLMGDDTIEVVPNLEISVGSSTDALGEYPITLQAGSPANYELTLQDSTLTVLPMVLAENEIVLTSPPDFVYSASPKTFTATSPKATNLTLNYLGRGSTSYSNSIAPSNVGTYSVIASSADPNYAGSKSQDFEITSRAISILVTNSVTKYYGEADPAFPYIITGLQGSDTAEVTSSREAGEELGGYTFTCQLNLSGSNYTITGSNTASGTLIILRMPVTLTSPTDLVYSKSPKTFSFVAAQTNNISIHYGSASSSAFSNTLTAPQNVGFYRATASQYAQPQLAGLEMVTIGDLENSPDTNGLGAVNYQYQISKYEVTLSQYAAFLNSVAKSDPYWLYEDGMGTASGQSSTNVALNKTVISSSTYEDNITAFGPQRVVNGNEGDYWLGKGSNEPGYLMPAFLEIDLGSDISISEVRIRNTTNNQYNDRGSKDFNVQIRSDFLPSQTVLVGTLGWQASSFQSFQLTEPKTCRYVRINILTAYGPYSCPGISEIQIISTSIQEKAYGINRQGSEGSYVYSVVGNSNLPITGVSPSSVRAFCNWLHQGCATNANLNKGSYYIPRDLLNRPIPTTNTLSSWAVFRLPTEDEWYKAAFYKAGFTNAGYWEYATRSDSAPASTQVGYPQNSARYGANNFAPVGSYPETTSSYGVSDMAGNAWEMFNDMTNYGVNYIGGGFDSLASDLNKTARKFGQFTNASIANGGFRVVSLPRTQTNTLFAIIPKQIDISSKIETVRSLYNGTTAVQTIQSNSTPIDGVLTGDEVRLGRLYFAEGDPLGEGDPSADYGPVIPTGWSGAFDSPGPSSIVEGEYQRIWATITGLTLTGADASNYSLPSSVRVLGVIMPSFLSWIESAGLSGANADKNADPDGDGVNNAAEFVFAGNPLVPGGGLIATESTPQGLKLRWVMTNINGFNWRLVGKGDLAAAWQNVNGHEYPLSFQPHPTDSNATIYEMIVPWDCPYRFFKIEAEIWEVDDPSQA